MPFSDIETHAAFKKLSISDLCAYLFPLLLLIMLHVTDSVFISLTRINGHSILIGDSVVKKIVR